MNAFNSSLPTDSRQVCDQIYAGQIYLLTSTLQTETLTQTVWQMLQTAFADLDPAWAHKALDNETFRHRLETVRKTLSHSPEICAHYQAILAELGFDPVEIAVDQPRLRAIVPGLEDLPAAAPVFFAHRDTWYANPSAQINLWIPLNDYPEAQTFAFWPDLFDIPVDNDSERFDYVQWQEMIGFQSLHSPQNSPYPGVTDPQVLEQNKKLGFACQRGQRLLFAAAHVHQTRPNPGPGIRYSLDLRFVLKHDQQTGQGAKDPDNRSQGCTFNEYNYFPSASLTNPGVL